MTLLVDIGNVLLRFCYQGLIDRVAPGSGAEVLDEVLGLRDRFETGQMDVPEFTATAKSLLGFEGSDEAFHEAWCGIFTPVPQMESLLPRWKIAGHQLVLFSNINPLHHPYCFREYPQLFAYFDEAIMSYQIGGMKPAPPMYDHAVEQLNIDPGETVYLDDLPANIETGRRYGFDGILVNWDEPEQVMAELASRGLS